MQEPKIFISYSWSSSHHQEMVKYWADRLIADGIDVILDIYDLNEGDNKYAFMESMVTDNSVTHVLVVCDSKYTEKANARAAGVGTESQIISSEVYKKVQQSKFIPILCEFDDDGEPIVPVFMDSRIGINFSTPELVNENWEQLVRLLYGKPAHVKPKKGKAPTYITSDKSLPTSPIAAKFESFKQALIQDKKGLSMFRQDFIDSCIVYADALRVREQPELKDLPQKILDDCGKLKPVRNYLCDWILLEGKITQPEEMTDFVISTLESVRGLASRPRELNGWNVAWFQAHKFFAYETFLYAVAALIKIGAYKVLHEVLTSNYIIPEVDRYGDVSFEPFDTFYGNCDVLQSALAPEQKNLISPEAELVNRQADRQDLPFDDIKQADLLILLMSFIQSTRWYPRTLLYSGYRAGYELFLRAEQHKYFTRLSEITGGQTADELRNIVNTAYEAHQVNQWTDFWRSANFKEQMNINKWDTIK